MNDNEVKLPLWLDDFIFKVLKGKYCRSNADMIVLYWNSEQILNYLGTYFPRSFAESYIVFKRFLDESNLFCQQNVLNLLDFGSGTGGEIFGLATSLADFRPNINELRVKAIDGNQFALRRYEEIKDEFNKHFNIKIVCDPTPIKIDDFYDLSILNSVIDERCDIVMSFKAICEFVTNKQFKERNPYEHLVKFMLPHLSEKGLMLLADVTSKNDDVKEWLPIYMDKGLESAGVSIIKKNDGFNETFVVSHSRQMRDKSKIAWRLIRK